MSSYLLKNYKMTEAESEIDVSICSSSSRRNTSFMKIQIPKCMWCDEGAKPFEALRCYENNAMYEKLKNHTLKVIKFNGLHGDAYKDFNLPSRLDGHNQVYYHTKCHKDKTSISKEYWERYAQQKSNCLETGERQVNTYSVEKKKKITNKNVYRS